MISPVEFEESDGISVFKHVLLLEALQTEDFVFLQAGGHDGVTFDPLRNFAKRFGWKGVVLEPQPAVFAKLVENYRDCPGVVCLNVAAGEEDGEVTLYKFEDSPSVPEHATMLASFNRNALEYNTHGYRFPIEEITVKTLSLATLVNDYCGGRLTLLQTDTEGFDYNIIRQLFALDAASLPNLVRFENAMTAMQLDELRRGLRSKGYKLQAFTEYGAPDVIATRRDFGDLDDRKIAIAFASVQQPPSISTFAEPLESVLSGLPPQLARSLRRFLYFFGLRQLKPIVADEK